MLRFEQLALLHSFTPILISRFLLNLRQVDRSPNNSTLETRSAARSASVRFNIPESVIGNLGESLREYDDDVVDEADDAGFSEGAPQNVASEGPEAAEGVVEQTGS